jgi:predicted phosphohydrolase
VRIVAVADTHTFQGDLKQVPDGDVFIHAGDLLRGGTFDELRLVLPWLQSLPHRHKIVVAGNHDRCFEWNRDASVAALGAGFTYLEDSAAVIDGVRFWGSPWQPEFNNWAFNLPRGEPLAAKWRLIPPDTDVLITHGPPRGIGDHFGADEREGCDDLLQAVLRVRPLLHLFGHIHQDGGCWRAHDTCFANVTTWECERGPTVIDVDVTKRTLTAVEIPPARKPRKR